MFLCEVLFDEVIQVEYLVDLLAAFERQHQIVGAIVLLLGLGVFSHLDVAIPVLGLPPFVFRLRAATPHAPVLPLGTWLLFALGLSFDHRSVLLL